MIELVLHPGHSKCGSTSVQRALLRNRNELEKNGVFLPDSNMKLSFEEGFRKQDDTPRAYFKKIHEASNDDELDRLLNEMRIRLERIRELAEKFNVKKIIISAENLINKLSLKNGYSIHNLLAEYFEKSRVVYCIRPEDDFIQSSWQQWDHKLGNSFEDYLSDCLNKGMPNYFFVANFLAKIYGKKNIRVIPINMLHRSNRNLIRMFFVESRVPVRNLDTSNEVFNETLNPYICKVASQVEGLYENVHDQSVKDILTKFFNGNTLLNKSSYTFICQEQRKKIQDLYSPRTEKLFKKFISDFQFDEFYKKTSEDELEPSEAIRKAYEELIAMFITQIVKQ
ncbi:hypothetical protein [Alteromonas sp. C1M14]|uniref:hypothetical protein n=1 Tax=Alteromonas sp. C1M14 TaxID=2841567 RepID=UPI001C098881|nr:hypothetical protein [Alteromonas sp. C1M14]MBU2977231.1 hypothetical protein [Alteromonas sp. C1M14]